MHSLNLADTSIDLHLQSMSEHCDLLVWLVAALQAAGQRLSEADDRLAVEEWIGQLVADGRQLTDDPEYYAVLLGQLERGDGILPPTIGDAAEIYDHSAQYPQDCPPLATIKLSKTCDRVRELSHQP